MTTGYSLVLTGEDAKIPDYRVLMRDNEGRDSEDMESDKVAGAMCEKVFSAFCEELGLEYETTPTEHEFDFFVTDGEREASVEVKGRDLDRDDQAIYLREHQETADLVVQMAVETDPELDRRLAVIVGWTTRQLSQLQVDAVPYTSNHNEFEKRKVPGHKLHDPRKFLSGWDVDSISRQSDVRVSA